ncbi:hypothetical protein [Gordonia jacobaea]|uniref:hypothetical protein n=1 Tax=Gordonia jacobaea TaxID=122202 RepID=UPI003D72F440
MSAEWQASFYKYPALVALRDNDYEALWEATRRSPMVEQIRKTMLTDHKRLRGEYRRCSPDARLIPEVSDALDRAKEMPVEPHGVPGSFWLSNCGRRILKDRNPGRAAQSYDDRLKQITIEQAVAERGPQARVELQRAEYDYDLAADVAEAGGSPIATVVVYSPRGIGNREYLVPQGWSRDRVMRYVTRAQKIPDCFFCDDDRGVDMFLQVDCGAVRRVLPTCFMCETRLQRESDLPLDIELAWDDWDVAAGWPDDRFR